MSAIPRTPKAHHVGIYNIVRHMCTAALLTGCAVADPQPGAAGDGGTADADIALLDATSGSDAGTSPNPDATTSPAKRIVILMIGDGLGPGQLDAASYYKSGATGTLTMQSLAYRGALRTASLSGITDSAASATMMATGQKTYNGYIGLDRARQPAQTLIELAKLQGLATGVVSTSAVTHATPASFTAHRTTRDDQTGIAEDQVRVVKPDVLLGGGIRYFLPAGDTSARDDAGLLDEIRADGYELVTTADELRSVEPGTDRVVGLFANDHLDYVLDRALDTTQPTLPMMARQALDILDQDPDGLFLVIEGSRIDMASHNNDLTRTMGETLAFDQTVQAVRSWAQGRDDVTIIVTADHETGGLQVVAPAAKGTLPNVTWRWENHTNAHVSVFAEGPGADLFDDSTLDHSWVHASLAARIEGRTVQPPPVVLTPDGHLSDLPYTASVQTNASGFGAGFNQLDALHLGSDQFGLGIGLSGAFQWDENAVVVLIDVDYGGATGMSTAAGAVTDATGQADLLIGSLQLDAPLAPGFGADMVLVVFGGADPHLEDLHADTGLRGLRAPYGTSSDLGWFGAAINFAPGLRARTAPAVPRPGEGLEAHIPWSTLFPGLDGAVPPGATIALVAVVVNDDGGYTSNQFLPPLVGASDNPGRVLTALPGVTVFTVDADGDGRGDQGSAPTCVPAP